MNAPRFRIREVRFGERQVKLRLPFKFGVVTLRETPQVFLRVMIQLENGREAWGETAELLVPKWFDKSPGLSNEQNVDQLRRSLRLAADAYRSDSGYATAFGHCAAHYGALLQAGGGQGLPPLAASFGGAELDKAVLDALCNALGVGFFHALQANLPGLEFALLAPDLEGFDGIAFLAGLRPLGSVQVRHTVGMLDPLTGAGRQIGEALDDGLPETLEQIIADYGQRYFKVKVSGDIGSDLERLQAVARVLESSLDSYHITLDGNEQFQDAEGVMGLWDAIDGCRALKRFKASILFIEQPIHRDRTMSCDLAGVAGRVPLIIDESDGDLEAFVAALDLGYSGVSSKACKGFYKSFINAARCQGAAARSGSRLFLSAEDLTCQAGLAVQQDLALIALLGIGHVERNGHHYVNGFAGAPDAEQQAFLQAHPDLYHKVRGRSCLNITQGAVQLGSLAAPGFACGARPDWSCMNEMKLETEG